MQSRIEDKKILLTFQYTLCFLIFCFVRIQFCIRGDFPINDGGMFTDIIRQINFSNPLPATVSFNSLTIPFAYPPLGFIFASLLHTAFGFEIIAILQWLPVTVSCLLFFPLLGLFHEHGLSRPTKILALIAFALMKLTFLWQIMGGGLTRSLGVFFAVSSCWLLLRAQKHFTSANILIAAISIALAALSHGEATIFIFSYAIASLVTSSRSLESLKRYILIASLAGVLIAPWYLWVLNIHGLQPFTSAHKTVESIFNLQSSSSIAQYLEQQLGYLLFQKAIIFCAFFSLNGILVTTRKSLFLPILMLLCICLDGRAGRTYATVPLAMMIAIGTHEVFTPMVRDIIQAYLPKRWKLNSGALALTYLLILGLCLKEAASLKNLDELQALPSSVREDFTHIETMSSPDSRFVIIDTPMMWSASASEWFPALAHRESLLTVQGSEWLPNDAFTLRIGRWIQFYDIIQLGLNNMESLLSSWSLQIDGIYFPYSEIPHYRLLYIELNRPDSPYLAVMQKGGTLFRKRDSSRFY